LRLCRRVVRRPYARSPPQPSFFPGFPSYFSDLHCLFNSVESSCLEAPPVAVRESLFVSQSVPVFPSPFYPYQFFCPHCMRALWDVDLLFSWPTTRLFFFSLFGSSFAQTPPRPHRTVVDKLFYLFLLLPGYRKNSEQISLWAFVLPPLASPGTSTTFFSCVSLPNGTFSTLLFQVAFPGAFFCRGAHVFFFLSSPFGFCPGCVFVM